MNKQKQYGRAKKRVQELKSFYIHLVVYVLGVGFLAFINLITSTEFLWFLFPAVGWGIIGLGAHAATTFLMDSSWEERKLKQVVAKERGEKLKRAGMDEDYFE